MAVLRYNKDSLMAVLEAFVYDPLLNWRLMDDALRANRSANATNNDIGSISGGSSTQDTTDILDSLSLTVGKKGTLGGGTSILNNETTGSQPEAVSKKALAIITRVRDKLTGQDFTGQEESSPLTVPKQVELLIQQATNYENLCQCYIGWCPFW